jgi:hypothetical protein
MIDLAPGAFASSPKTFPHPTAILLLTEQAEPFTEATANAAYSAVGLNQQWKSWHSPSWPPYKLAIPISSSDKEGRFTFACKRGEAVPESRREHVQDPLSNWSIAQYAGECIHDLLLRWSTYLVLILQRRLLAQLREETARDTFYRAIGDLKALRRTLRAIAFDVSKVATEVGRLPSGVTVYGMNSASFQQSLRSGETVQLLDWLQDGQRELSKSIEEDARFLTDALSTLGRLTETISNIRTQRFILGVALLSLGAALAAILLSVKP